MKVLVFVIITLISSICVAQIVDIPDSNFKNYLVSNTEVNTNGDSEIQVSEAVAFSGALVFQFFEIDDLTGIQAFVNLTFLDCGDNNLTQLDLSQNLALEQLYCYDNELTTLDLSQNTALFALDCRNNSISNLDLSGNPNLEYLQCTFNEMNSLDLTQNTALTTLRCFSNDIEVLDVTNNTALVNLYASFNNIMSLDLSQNNELVIIECEFNELNSLDVSNGNNTNVITYRSNGNPNLECIQVDDPVYSQVNWTNVDPTSTFSEDCDVLDISEEKELEIIIYPNPVAKRLYFRAKKPLGYTIISLDGNVHISGVVTSEAQGIDLTNLSSGIYFVRIIDSGKNAIIKKILKS